MDVLKSIDTNIQVIKDFSSIAYHLFAISKRKEPDNVATKDDPSLEDLLKLEVQLRESDAIFHTDRAQRQLWLFRNEVERQPQESLLKVDQFAASGVTLTSIYRGVFKSSEIAPLAARSAGNVGTAHTPTTSGLAGERKTMHAMFISAITAYIAATLCAADYGVPISANTFGVFAFGTKEVCKIVTWRIFLTTSGTMIISHHRSRDSSARQRPLCPSDYQTGRQCTVQLLPTMTTASLVQNVDSSRNASSDKVSASWKSLVSLWLKSRGIAFDALDSSESWVTVSAHSIPAHGHPEAIAGFEGLDKFSWPERLCYVTDDFENSSKEIDCVPSVIDRVDQSFWFRSMEDGGMEDAFHFVERWFKDKPSRENAIAVLKNARLASNLELKLDHQPLEAASSPVVPRSAHELQAIAGMYPTPPDGLSSAVGYNSIEAIAGEYPPIEGQGESGLPANDSDGVSLGTTVEQSLVPITDHLMSTDLDTFADPLDEKDDLFGFSDGEENIGNDDFDFFDEPDAEPVEVIDTSPKQVMVKDTPTFATNEMPETIDADILDEANTEAIDVMEEPVIDQKPSTPIARTADIEVLPSDDNPTTSQQATQPGTAPAHAPLDQVALRELLSSDAVAGAARAEEFRAVRFAADVKDMDSSYRRNQHSAAAQQIARRASIKPQLSTERSVDVLMSNGEPADQNLKRRWSARDCDEEDSSASVSSDDDYQATDTVRDATMLADEALSDDMKPHSAMVDGKDKIGQQNLLQALMAKFDHVWTISRRDRCGPTGDAAFRFAMPESTSPNSRLAARYILAAQFVAEQLSSTTLDMLHKTPDPFDSTISSIPEEQVLSRLTCNQSNPISVAAATAQSLDLLSYTGLQDLAHEQSLAARTQPRMPPRRLTGLPGESNGPIASCLGAPHVRVRRAEGLWDILPTGVQFWETIGLAPVNGPKDVMAYCIYPDNEGLRLQVDGFIDQLSSAWDKCKLGSHNRGPNVGDFQAGLVPLVVEDPITKEIISTGLRALCERLGKLLVAAKPHPSEFETDDACTSPRTIIIYIIDPCRSKSFLKDICAAFCKLCYSYMKAARSPGRQRPNIDIVLQIIPIKYVACDGIPVYLDAITLGKLAREVYDRCPIAQRNARDTSQLRIPSAAAVQLEEHLPRKIDFKVTIDPPQDLLRDNSHLHVAYARSSVSNWVTAAWTSNSGKYQATASYYLNRGQSFLHVAREIWQTTMDIIGVRKVQWRVCIARAGIMEQDEIEAWTGLMMGPTPSPLLALLIAVDPDPPLELHRKASTAIPAEPNTQGGNVAAPNAGNTPAATPQAGVSPDTRDTVATPATPSAADSMAETIANDPDAHLVDVTDETWAVILSHRVNIAPDMRDYRPSMSSGLIIKTNIDAANSRLGVFADEEEGTHDDRNAPIYAAIHLIWVGSSLRNTPATSLQQQQQQLQGMQLPQISTAPSSSESLGAGTPASQAQQQSWLGNFPKATADGILREYMQIFRNLGVLARVRGLRETRAGCLPWHVVIVKRALEGLEVAMGDE